MKSTEKQIAPFWTLLESGRIVNVNQGVMPTAIYNLIIHIRDCSLYANGIRPHRYWKITDVKNYYGISGSAEKMKEQLQQILNDYKNR